MAKISFASFAVRSSLFSALSACSAVKLFRLPLPAARLAVAATDSPWTERPGPRPAPACFPYLCLSTCPVNPVILSNSSILQYSIFNFTLRPLRPRGPSEGGLGGSFLPLPFPIIFFNRHSTFINHHSFSRTTRTTTPYRFLIFPPLFEM